MSGTSLDGLDIAFCEFSFTKTWKFALRFADTMAYSKEWRTRLAQAHLLSAEDLLTLHASYGVFLGQQVKQFIRQHKVKHVDFIASHGHTIFHQPEKGFTFQLGQGSAIHAAADLPVIYDFRSLDVARGGEGAPLVPIGDKFLFPEYDVCLNLGGIGNLSMDIKGQRKAFDICYCNMAMNYVMNKEGKSFDAGGEIASSGKVNKTLLEEFEKIYSGYHAKRPSIGREGFEKSVQPLLDAAGISTADKLRTICESVAGEVAAAIAPVKKKGNLLATGGGALNTFLVQVIAEKLTGRANVIVPPARIIEFKEALVFAFLGVLRTNGKTNVLKSVTRARQDSSGGEMIGF